MKQVAFVANILILIIFCSSGAFAASDSGVAKGAAPPTTNKNFKDKTTGMEFVFVKGGCFQMGDIFNLETGELEKPVHKVCVSDFSIGKYEVTQGEWQKVMGKNPSTFIKCGANCPVESISWNDAQEFIMKLNKKSGLKFRLPTEAEWEYAARSGGKEEQFSGGMKFDDVAWHRDNSAGSTHPVGTKKPNGLGLYDMSGNVKEWCNDWLGDNYYAESPVQDPKGPATGTDRIVRGGNWASIPSESGLRTTSRVFDAPDYRENTYGLRLVLQPK
jgi:formylglycine-generating enzyme required for sulfatase activity